jgi:HEPN domain-containing protein
MSDKRTQAAAYLDEATTLDGAKILFEHRSGGYAQVVKNAYDALEQALSAGIAHKGEDIPQYHNGKVTRFFGLYERDSLEQKSLKWLSKRETARYVDFEAGRFSIPEENFDESDAEEILEDAQATLEFVSGQIEE